MSFFTDVLYFK